MVVWPRVVVIMVRPWIVLLLAAALVLSGCLGGEDVDPEGPSDDETETSGGDPADESDGNETSSENGNGSGENETAPAPNRAPTATLAASTDQGDAPLNVNFTLDAEDPDDDALSWILDLGDGTSVEGTELPFAVDHEYESGTYLVVFNVTDGEFFHAVNVTVDSIRQPNAAQEGSITVCQKHYILPAVFGFVPFNEGETVDVEVGTGWQVEADGPVQVQFWNADGGTVGGFIWATTGVVPGGAASATVCVAPTQAPVYTVPTPGATFTYQDGFPVPAA